MTPRIVFFCGRSAEPWGPPSLDTTGIGGSETAVVKIAERFARDGWRVDVYCGAGRYEGEYEGVGYWEPSRLGYAGDDERADVLVAWRQPAAHSLPVRARCRVVWLHDHNHGPDAGAELGRFDRVLGVSDYHRRFLGDAYGLENVGYVPNGIDLDRFDPTIKKVPGRCVYASSPDRGLMLLLKLWPKIVGDQTHPELHVAYGWDNFDKWIGAGRHDMAAFKDECMRLIERTPRVVFRGRLPQDELARLYCESYASLYPGDFCETSYIGGMEAMAGGCVPVVSSVGATKETVADGGLVVWGPNGTRSNPYSRAWQDFYVQCARAVLFEANTRLSIRARGLERAKRLTWDISYEEHWKPLVEALLHGEAPATEPERDTVAA